MEKKISIEFNSECSKELTFKIQLFASLFMTGLIWLVQVVQYPIFLKVSGSDFSMFHSFYTRNITYIVLPVMLIELVTFILMGRGHLYHYKKIYSLMAFCLACIWLSTGLLLVPLHDQLAHGWEQNLIVDLVNINWLRTISWTVKSFCLLAVL